MSTIDFQPVTCPTCGAQYPWGNYHFCGAQWGKLASGVVLPYVEAMNDHIACEPFKNDLTDAVKKGTGFNTMKGLTTLTPLFVVFGNKDILAGQTVYVRADLAKEPASKQEFEVEGRKIVFIPLREVRLVKRFDAHWPNPTTPAPIERG